jgi:hypothetical protein
MLRTFGIVFCGNLVHFPRVGELSKEKSGQPGGCCSTYVPTLSLRTSVA